jgi:predicted hydrocarbon binding protein
LNKFPVKSNLRGGIKIGVKGWFGFRLKTKKTSVELFQALMAGVIDMFLTENDGDIEKTSEDIKELGERMTETLLMGYAEKMSEHAPVFEKFKDTLALAYKFYSGRSFTNVIYEPEKKVIRFEDDDCFICRDITLTEDLKDLKYCSIVPGIFTGVLKLRGFSGDCNQVECRAAGGKTCAYELVSFE